MPIRAPSKHELHALHRAFRSAFSDYLVPELGHISLEAFQALLLSRGWEAEASRVETGPNGDIVAFWLTGLESSSAGPLAYDIATAVVPEYRRRGSSTRLWRALQSDFHRRGVSSCQLEVIESNRTAVELYRALGFEVTRRFDCFRRATDGANDSPTPSVPGSPTVSITRLDAPPGGDVRAWWEWSPSWQHSASALRRAGHDASWLFAHAEGELVGYAALLHSAKDLAQLVVAPSRRRAGIARRLLAAATEQEPQLRVLNVDASDAATQSFLRAAGFERFTTQLEMRVHLAAPPPEPKGRP